MLSFLPLHKSSLEMSESLLDWICSWVGTNTSHLTPNDLFEKGHDIKGWHPPDQHYPFHRPALIERGSYIWAPPPAATDVALEELQKARHKSQSAMHVFVCQQLLTTRWFKQLHKACNIVLEIPAGPSFWKLTYYEPLIVGLVFPFIRSKPWQLRGTPKMFGMARQLRQMWEENELAARNLLREFCVLCWKLGAMPEGMVSRVLYK
ncbi:hypothetical protein ACA910_013007 [Epithemia clementina (nom. ined.)]